ncbi:MAG: hypothetical protein M1118_11970 [Chloroflexi bacterium]|nr:hypothetical protein [Chloroflexota bacterium]
MAAEEQSTSLRSNGRSSSSPGRTTAETRLAINNIITRLRQDIECGDHWYVALLQAIARWEEPVERFHGRQLTYLVGGEALDWLVLAERLTAEIRDLIPDEERTTLIFHGEPPLILSTEAFREYIGPDRYRCFLNFFYGVVVEEALFFLLEEEARRSTVSGRASAAALDAIYRDLYGAPEAELLAEFNESHALRVQTELDVDQFKAFTYFLFKRRVLYCLPARVASDTKRGLDELRRQWVAARRRLVLPGRPDGTAQQFEKWMSPPILKGRSRR